MHLFICFFVTYFVLKKERKTLWEKKEMLIITCIFSFSLEHFQNPSSNGFVIPIFLRVIKSQDCVVNLKESLLQRQMYKGCLMHLQNFPTKFNLGHSAGWPGPKLFTLVNFVYFKGLYLVNQSVVNPFPNKPLGFMWLHIRLLKHCGKRRNCS